MGFLHAKNTTWFQLLTQLTKSNLLGKNDPHLCGCFFDRLVSLSGAPALRFSSLKQSAVGPKIDPHLYGPYLCTSVAAFSNRFVFLNGAVSLEAECGRSVGCLKFM